MHLKLFITTVIIAFTFLTNKVQASTNVLGGVIYNFISNIDTIEKDFENYQNSTNTGNIRGGIIYNYYSSTIGTIIGTFANNYISSINGFAVGGVLENYNNSSIDIIIADFINNSAYSAYEYARGGAIFNNYTSTINSISGNFIKNSVSSDTGYSYGGAINNTSIINNINANFINNSATSNTNIAYGGAIYNTGTINSLTGFFSNNLVESNTNLAYGGAIYNTGTINFTGTSTLATQSDTIYNIGTITINKGSSLTNYSTITNKNKFYLDGGTYGFSVESTGDIDSQAGGYITGSLTIIQDSYINPIVAIGVSDGTYTFADKVIIQDGDLSLDISDTLDYDLSLYNNALYDIKFTDDNLNTISITKKPSEEIQNNLADMGANKNQSNAIDAIISSNNTNNKNFNDISNNINSLLQSSSLSDITQGLKLVNKVSSDTTSAPKLTSLSVSGQIANIVSKQLAAKSNSQGLTSGDASIFDKTNIWVKGLANESELSNNDGFKVTTYGTAFGIDKKSKSNLKLGMGYAYTSSGITTDSRSTDVINNTAILYAEYKPQDIYINTIATYSLGNYKENSDIKESSYDVKTLNFQTMLGKEIDKCSFIFSPEIGLRYIHIIQSKHKDTLGSYISSDNSDILTAVISSKFSKSYSLENNIILRPEIRFGLSYDIANDNSNSTITLVNGSAYTTTSQALDRLAFELNFGFTTEINENIDISLNYEGKFRNNYTDNSGIINLKYNL